MDHKDLVGEAIDQARAQEIADGVHRVLDQIASAESAARRAADSVRLLAITKTRDVGEILVTVDAGIRVIGENRSQEITVEADGLAERLGERGYSLDMTDAAGANTTDAAVTTHTPFHLISQLQANKIGRVLPVVDIIEFVDSTELAEKIARRATIHGITIGVSLEVNEPSEESKFDCAPSHATDLAQRIGAMSGLRLQGSMTIGAHVDDGHTIHASFAHLRRTRDQTPISGAESTADCTKLSMGMTHDMAYAIEGGPTIVRVSIVIFDERASI